MGEGVSRNSLWEGSRCCKQSIAGQADSSARVQAGVDEAKEGEEEELISTAHSCRLDCS